MMKLSSKKNNWSICIQGPNEILGNRLKMRFQEYGLDVIYVTWKSDTLVQTINPTTVYLNNVPAIYKDPLTKKEHNANRMRILAIEGLLKVKNKYVLRVRDDVEFGDISLLLEGLFKLEPHLDNKIAVLNTGTAPFDYFAFHISDYLTIGTKEHQIAIWINMNVSQNKLPITSLLKSKILFSKTGFRATRYACEQQLGISTAKHFGLSPSIKFIDDAGDMKLKSDFLKHIIICSENYLQIVGPTRLFDENKLKYTPNTFGFMDANEIKYTSKFKTKRVKSLLGLILIAIISCIST